MSELAQKIRSRGHWEVTLRPTEFDEKRIKSLADLERAFKTARVQLRGWDYPHEPRDGPTRHKDFIQGSVSWEMHHEIWRLYQSGQFVHLFAMNEDWYAESGLLSGQPHAKVKPGELLEVVGILFIFTEIFLFAARLVEALNLGPEVTLSYKLVRLGGRQLQTLDVRRMPLHEWRKASLDLHEYGDDLTLPASKLIGGATELAVDQAMALYERFHWEPPRQTLIEDQRKLLERRF